MKKRLDQIKYRLSAWLHVMLERHILQGVGLWVLLIIKVYSFLVAINDPVDPTAETPADLLWYRIDAVSWVIVILIVRWYARGIARMPAVLLHGYVWYYFMHEFVATGWKAYPSLMIGVAGFTLFEIAKYRRSKRKPTTKVFFPTKGEDNKPE